MKSIKCVVIGDGAVGKTSLLISYTTNTFLQDYTPTIFDNYTTTVSHEVSESDTKLLSYIDEYKNKNNILSDGKLFVKLNLWDTAGQEEYDKLRPLSYPQTDIFLICFSINEVSSFLNVFEKWIPEIKQISNFENSNFYKSTGKLPILLVGTKSDLRDVELKSTQVQTPEILECVKDNNLAGYQECSAALQDGVSDIFDKSIDIILFEPARALYNNKKLRKDSRKKNKRSSTHSNNIPTSPSIGTSTSNSATSSIISIPNSNSNANMKNNDTNTTTNTTLSNNKKPSFLKSESTSTKSVPSPSQFKKKQAMTPSSPNLSLTKTTPISKHTNNNNNNNNSNDKNCIIM